MDLFHILAEERIKKAYDEGEFDHLPGYGKPLKLEDLSSVPEELRIAYKILKNAGFTEEENQLKNEMLTISDLLKICADDDEKEKLEKKLSKKLLQFNRLLSKRRVNTNSAMFKKYENKLNKKFRD